MAYEQYGMENLRRSPRKENVTIGTDKIKKVKFLGKTNKPDDPIYRENVIAQLVAYQEKYKEELRVLAERIAGLSTSQDQGQDT